MSQKIFVGTPSEKNTLRFGKKGREKKEEEVTFQSRERKKERGKHLLALLLSLSLSFFSLFYLCSREGRKRERERGPFLFSAEGLKSPFFLLVLYVQEDSSMEIQNTQTWSSCVIRNDFLLVTFPWAFHFPSSFWSFRPSVWGSLPLPLSSSLSSSLSPAAEIAIQACLTKGKLKIEKGKLLKILPPLSFFLLLPFFFFFFFLLPLPTFQSKLLSKKVCRRRRRREKPIQTILGLKGKKGEGGGKERDALMV